MPVSVDFVAALELERAGHHVRIVEARQRIGGRVHTQRARDGAPMAEAGAGRIPRSHRWTWDYIDQMGLATRPLYPAGLKNVALINGKRWVVDATTDLTVDLPTIPLPRTDLLWGARKSGLHGLKCH
ncbi:FAD-dependent oxidoreductase [Kaistia dalseonensis]|uniref:FAD-dependent oxidoreductase n=1 Tax=Kaistia dalseonensis TaxID=410840 RepID=UPI002258F3E5|nr:FAD-dependent oxidoreductase [Kaistia dalseonensis]MCX5495730.1 FAD-dependent oxidoreductase [Kaistia dalseonensis]